MLAFKYKPLRLVLLEDGRALGCFSRTLVEDSTSTAEYKNKSETSAAIQIFSHAAFENVTSAPGFEYEESVVLLLLLEKSGGSYTCIDALGKRTRGVTAFASKEFLNPLKMLVNFRNSHFDIPYIHERFIPRSKVVKLSRRIKVVRWPAASTTPNNYRFSENGEISVSSLDGSCVLHLSCNGLIARVSSLTPLSCSLQDMRYVRIPRILYVNSNSNGNANEIDSDKENKNEKHSRYEVILKHVEMVRKRLLSETKENTNTDANKHDGTEKQCYSYISQDITRCPPDAHSPSWDNGSDEFLIAYSTDPMGCYEYGNGFGKTIIEWTSVATYHIRHTQKNRISVLAHIHADDSFLEVQGCKGIKFFQHKSQNFKTERVYAETAVPRVIRCSGKREYVLQKIADHSLCLLKKAMLSAEQRNNNGTASMSSKLSENEADLRIVKEEYVVNLGRFTAFSNKKISVLFADRTILHSNNNFTECQIVLSHGEAVTVNVQNPVHVEWYVRAAGQFWKWVFSPTDILQDKITSFKRIEMIVNSQRASRMQQGQIQHILSTLKRHNN